MSLIQSFPDYLTDPLQNRPVRQTAVGPCRSAPWAGDVPSEIGSPALRPSGEAPTGRTLRVGGLVVPGSIQREEGSLTIRFDLTDQSETVTVAYTGILPDLFREGQGIVAMGSLDGAGTFQADEVLAKHDENYMPPEVAEALKMASEGGQISNPHSGAGDR